MIKLPESFFINNDVLELSRKLLGKVIVTNFDHCVTSGMIVETEAYRAPEDKASHAYNNRRTKRTEIMFAKGGAAYIYLCYGIHHLFNIVTGPENTAHAILIRAIQPVDGVEFMLKRRSMDKFNQKLTAGPGTLTQALGIKTKHNGKCLITSEMWIEDRGIVVPDAQIGMASRIGIAYAEEFIHKPWRFFIKDNPWVSVKI